MSCTFAREVENLQSPEGQIRVAKFRLFEVTITNGAWARVGGPPRDDRYFVLGAPARHRRGSEKNDRDMHKNWSSYVAKILVSRIERDLVRWSQTVPDYRRWQYLGDLACLRAR